MHLLNRFKGVKRAATDLGAVVDPDTFLEMLEIFNSASKDYPDDPQEALRKATAAVHATLGARKIASAPYLIRIRALPQLFKEQEILDRYAPSNRGEDAVPQVRQCLLRAAARARFSLMPKSFGYDIKDVMERAAALAEQEASAEL